MRRSGAAAALPLVVVVLAVALAAVAVPEHPSPAGAVSCASVPALPPLASAPADSLVGQGNALATAGELGAADVLYRQALAAPEPAAGAGQGLARTRAARAAAARVAASAAALGGTAAEACYRRALGLDAADTAALAALTTGAAGTAANRSSSAWDGVVSDWLDPGSDAVLPVLAVLVALLLAARVATSSLVPPRARAWPEPVRRAAWAAGVVLLVAVALRGALVEGWSPSLADRLPALGRWGTALLGLVLAAVVVAASRGVRRWPRNSTLVAGVLLLVAVVAADVLVPGLRRVPDVAWSWLLSAVLALLGVVLVAAGRGSALRVEVRVGPAGSGDEEASAYLLGRLQQLGSAPPRGLKAPQQVDVTDLPKTAVTALPVGRLATAVAAVVGLLTPSVPWRAVVRDAPDGGLTVTLTRNGPVAASVVIPPGDRAELLTAAAAVVLTEVATRHPRLGAGLCGATQWQSVAAHVVATSAEPVDDDGRRRRRELLARAVQRDPRNALARLAYVQVLGEELTGDAGWHAQGRRLDTVWTEVTAQCRATLSAHSRLGYDPLLLRILHARTATWLNAAVADKRSGTVRTCGTACALCRAESAYCALVARLALPAGDPAHAEFVDEMRMVAVELRRAFEPLARRGCRTDVENLPPARSVPGSRPPSLTVLYDQACRQAQGGSAAERAAALERLLLPAGLPALRDAARHDPWLAGLRALPEHDPAKRAYRTVVGPPAASFLDDGGFGDQGPALAALGVTDRLAFLDVTASAEAVRELARALDVPAVVVRRWRAEFTATPPLPDVPPPSPRQPMDALVAPVGDE